VETSRLDDPGASELQDSVNESDADPTGHELQAFTAHESHTEIPDDFTSSLPADRSIIDVPAKQFDTSTHLSNKTSISLRIHGHC